MTRYGDVRCDVAHAIKYTGLHAATIDLNRRVRVVGIPGTVRFLCDDCARGRIYPLTDSRWRLAGAPNV